MDFETLDGSDRTCCCRIAIPARSLFSQRYATKRSAHEGIQVQHMLEHISSAEALMLRGKVFESDLPDADDELEEMLDNIEAEISRFRRFVERISDFDRGIVEGDEWKRLK
jgi:hypothetical protein